MILANKLENLRIEKGKTKQQVANETGLGITSIKNYENKKMNRMPDTNAIKKLAEYYTVSYDYLLDDECENRTPEKISIGKSLKLSDTSIQRIKDLQYTEQPNLYFKHNSTKEENTVSPNSFNFFIENFDNLHYFTLLYAELLNLINIYNDLNIYIYIFSIQFYIVDCLSNGKKLDELFKILDDKIDSIRSNYSEDSGNLIFISESLEDLISCKEDLKKYCTSYNKTSNLNTFKDNSLNMDTELYEILNDIFEISQNLQYQVKRNIDITKYELIKLFSDFFDSYEIEKFKNDEVPTELAKLKKNIKNM